MKNPTISSVSSRTVTPELLIEIKGSKPHIGKSCAAEVCRRALEKAGFLEVVVKTQDGDNESLHFRDLGIFSEITSRTKVTIIDNNQRLKR